MIHKEVANAPFNATLGTDLWKNQMINTNSLRSMKSIQASLECIKEKDVTFTLPEINQKKEDNNSSSVEKNMEAKVTSLKNSGQNFFFCTPRNNDEVGLRS